MKKNSTLGSLDRFSASRLWKLTRQCPNRQYEDIEDEVEQVVEQMDKIEKKEFSAKRS